MLWIVEPHVDDAFLSMHSHMKHWIKSGRNVGILTVFSTSLRDKEGEEYAKSIGASHRSLTIKEGMKGLNGSSPNIPPVDDWCIDISAGDRMVFPIGLQHPDHIRVRDAAPDNAWYYLDTPYQAKQKLGEDLLSKIVGMRILSIIYPHANKWKSIPIFKSQAKFFHFNPAEKMLRIPEILVRK
jgi:hypothetical protein